MELHLSPRLQAAAGLIGPLGGVCDVGTDHAYLPVYLALQGREGRLVAADLREGPLSRARETARRYGVTQKLEFCLSDGLENVTGANISWVVIAGMGGETVRGILQRAKWLEGSGVTLVLQPQSKHEELTAWLGENGWMLCDTAMAKDAGRIYPLFTVKQTEKCGAWDEAEIYASLAKKREPLLGEYLALRISMLKDALSGMYKGGDAMTERISAAKKSLEALETIYRETETW